MSAPEQQEEAAVDDDVVLDEGRTGVRTALVASVIAGLVIAGLVVVLATRDSSVDRAGQSHLLGKVAPTVAGATLDGGEYSMATHRGRWVVVNFFATWCVPCQIEHPELVDFHERHREIGDATVVSVLFDDEADTAAAFFEREGGEWPVVVDADRSISVAYGVARVPESFLVAPDGTVVQRLVGGVTAEDLDALLTAYTTRGGEAPGDPAP